MPARAIPRSGATRGVGSASLRRHAPEWSGARSSGTLGGYSLIAQLVERRTVNPQVPGSSPGRGAKTIQSDQGLAAMQGLFCCRRCIGSLPYPGLQCSCWPVQDSCRLPIGNKLRPKMRRAVERRIDAHLSRSRQTSGRVPSRAQRSSTGVGATGRCCGGSSSLEWAEAASRDRQGSAICKRWPSLLEDALHMGSGQASNLPAVSERQSHMNRIPVSSHSCGSAPDLKPPFELVPWSSPQGANTSSVGK